MQVKRLRLSRITLALGSFVCFALALALTLAPAPPAAAIDEDECAVLTSSGSVGPVTRSSNVDCHWAEMDVRDELGSLMQAACRPDKVCTSNMQFSACDDNDPPPYVVTGTGTYSCGNFF